VPLQNPRPTRAEATDVANAGKHAALCLMGCRAGTCSICWDKGSGSVHCAGDAGGGKLPHI